MGCLIDWLIDWSIDWLIDWFFFRAGITCRITWWPVWSSSSGSAVINKSTPSESSTGVCWTQTWTRSSRWYRCLVGVSGSMEISWLHPQRRRMMSVSRWTWVNGSLSARWRELSKASIVLSWRGSTRWMHWWSCPRDWRTLLSRWIIFTGIIIHGTKSDLSFVLS